MTQNGFDNVVDSPEQINNRDHLQSDDVFAPTPNGLPFNNHGFSFNSKFDRDSTMFGGNAAQQPDPFITTPVHDNDGFRKFDLPGDAIDMGYVNNVFGAGHTPPQLNANFNKSNQYGMITPPSFSSSSNGSQGGIDPMTIAPAIKQHGSFDSGYATARGSNAGLPDALSQEEIDRFMQVTDAGNFGGYGNDGTGNDTFHNEYFDMGGDEGYEG